jgi:hypothetical protein
MTVAANLPGSSALCGNMGLGNQGTGGTPESFADGLLSGAVHADDVPQDLLQETADVLEQRAEKLTVHLNFGNEADVRPIHGEGRLPRAARMDQFAAALRLRRMKVSMPQSGDA